MRAQSFRREGISVLSAQAEESVEQDKDDEEEDFVRHIRQLLGECSSFESKCFLEDVLGRTATALEDLLK